MKNKIGFLALLYLLFLMLLLVSGLLGGILSEAVYLLAFLLPFGIGCLRLYKERSGALCDFLSLPSKEHFSLFVPVIIPAISAIMLTSFITSSLIYRLFGVTSEVELESNIIVALCK